MNPIASVPFNSKKIKFLEINLKDNNGEFELESNCKLHSWCIHPHISNIAILCLIKE
jgi:hypothetical protein